MFSGHFSLVIQPAQVTKKSAYDDAYGPDVLEVKATYRGNVVYHAFTMANNSPTTAGHILNSISLASELAPGIDTAHEQHEGKASNPAT